MNHKRERQVLVLMDQLEAVRETLAQLNADELTSVGSINPVFKKRREGFLKAFNAMLYGLNSGLSLLDKLMASVPRPKRGVYQPDEEEVIAGPRKSGRRTKTRGSVPPIRHHLRKLVGGPMDGETISLSDDASSTITFGYKGQLGYYHNSGSGDSLYWEEAIIEKEPKQPMLKGIKGGRK